MPRSSDPGNRLTRAGIAAFLDALAETGMVVEAARRARVPRATLYRRKAADADFAARWAAALEAGLDGLRDEAVRRARDGVEETVWHRGEAVGTRRRYSDALLMFLLRAHQPAIYREPRTGDAAAAQRRLAQAKQAQDKAIADAVARGRDAAIDEMLKTVEESEWRRENEAVARLTGNVAGRAGWPGPAAPAPAGADTS